MDRKRKKSLFPPLYLLSLLLAHTALAQGQHIIVLEKTLRPEHVWVQFREMPQHEAVISWTTTLPGDVNKVYFDIVPQDCELSSYRYSKEEVHSGAFTLTKEEESMRAYYHHVFLDDLQPSTRYYFTVTTDGEILGEFHFETAPADDRTVSVLQGGDSRLDEDRIDSNNPRRGMNSRMRELLEKNPMIIGLAHTADYTESGIWSEFYYWIKDHFEETTTSEGRLLPIFPSRGNHDMEPSFEELFWWPDEDQNYYYTAHINKNTVIIILNTEISILGDQRIWLEEQLALFAPKKRWITTLLHRPVFPSVRGFSGEEPRRRAWVPLFERYHVDLVTSGHDHALKRTLPIFDLEPSPNGIVYIGDGGLGVRPREVDNDRWYLGMAQGIHNVHLVEYSQNQIDIRAFGMDGTVLDSFFIPSNLRHRRAHYRNVIREKKLEQVDSEELVQENKFDPLNSLPEFDWWIQENLPKATYKLK